ncbi:MAG TPA: BatD family protein [Pricia sp.]|nr:BatD family protein [Pricia sp.]
MNWKLEIGNWPLDYARGGTFWNLPGRKADFSFLRRCAILFLFLLGFQGFCQKNPSVTSKVDTTAIKIGEQIHFTVTVEADSTAQVIFPEGQTFSPLETVEAFATDTTRKNDRMTLQKTYALTQFDSGAYQLPPQRIDINGKGFFTDSTTINVASVPVDTLAQKMYDIKPLMEVQKSRSELWWWVLGILLGLAVVGGLLYGFVFRKKPLTEEEKVALLPAYDRALLELKKLENSKYLIQDEYKQYYSELTGIVRAYLEEDVHVTAMESTTDELVYKLELLRDAGELRLEDDTLKQFKRILQTADLVKFARSKPESSVAQNDRKAIEEIVTKTHDALPEPTLEERMEQEEYKEEQAHKAQRRKIAIAAAAVLGFLLVTAGIAVARYGFEPVRDTVFGHPTKTMLEGEWIASTYGYPPISLETPKVLKRQSPEIPPEQKANLEGIQAFRYQSPDGLFSMAAKSTMLSQQTEPDYERSIESFIKSLESRGAKNIITKDEEFTTVTGVKGIKIYGSAQFTTPDSNERVRGKYSMLLFGGPGFQQQITLTWRDGDTYAEQIVERILNTVEVKTEV